MNDHRLLLLLLGYVIGQFTAACVAPFLCDWWERRRCR